MCNRCQELKKELKGKVLSNKDFFHSLLYDAGIIKKADPEHRLSNQIKILVKAKHQIVTWNSDRPY